MRKLVTTVNWFSSYRNRKAVQNALHTIYISSLLTVWCDAEKKQWGGYDYFKCQVTMSCVRSSSRGRTHRIMESQYIQMCLSRGFFIKLSNRKPMTADVIYHLTCMYMYINLWVCKPRCRSKVSGVLILKSRFNIITVFSWYS